MASICRDAWNPKRTFISGDFRNPKALRATSAHSGFVHPASLLSRRAEFFLKRLPEAKRAIADGEFRRDGEAAGFQIRQEFAPGLGAFPIARLKPNQLFFALRRGTDQDKNALLE